MGILVIAAVALVAVLVAKGAMAFGLGAGLAGFLIVAIMGGFFWVASERNW